MAKLSRRERASVRYVDYRRFIRSLIIAPPLPERVGKGRRGFCLLTSGFGGRGVQLYCGKKKRLHADVLFRLIVYEIIR